MDRTWTVRAVRGGQEIAATLARFDSGAPCTAAADVSILDGELVEIFEKNSDGISGLGKSCGWMYLVFDAILIAGQDVGSEPSLHTRLQRVAEAVALFSPPPDPMDDTAALRLYPKHMVPALEAQTVLEAIKLVEYQGGSPEEKVRVTSYDIGGGTQVDVMNDGLVFTPVEKAYYKLNLVLKVSQSVSLG